MKFALPPLTPAVRAILVVLFASFVVQTLVDLAGVPLFDWLALQPDLSVRTAWQWATYPLVELPIASAVVRRAFDLLFVYWLVGAFEQNFGTRKAFVLAAIGIVSGAVLPLLLSLVLPGMAASYAGASPIAWAGLAAYAIITRGQPLQLVLLPQMNAWTLAGILFVISTLEAAWLRTPTFLLGAIGGFAAGIVYTRWLEKPPARKPPPPKRRTGGSHLHVIPGGQSEDERPRWLN